MVYLLCMNYSMVRVYLVWFGRAHSDAIESVDCGLLLMNGLIGWLMDRLSNSNF